MAKFNGPEEFFEAFQIKREQAAAERAPERPSVPVRTLDKKISFTIGSLIIAGIAILLVFVIAYFIGYMSGRRQGAFTTTTQRDVNTWGEQGGEPWMLVVKQYPYSDSGVTQANRDVVQLKKLPAIRQASGITAATTVRGGEVLVTVGPFYNTADGVRHAAQLSRSLEGGAYRVIDKIRASDPRRP
jgi:hypothetical protein